MLSIRIKKTCERCGKKYNDVESHINRRKYCGVKCSRLASRKCKHPTKRELLALLKNNSFCAIGRLFNVSDNAVRKWAKQYNIIPQ